MNLIKIKTLAVYLIIFTLCTFIEIKSVEIPNITPQELMQKVKEKYDSHSSISFISEFKMKYIGKDDTAKVVVDAKLFRVPTDTIFGGIINFTTNGNYSIYYNLEKLYSIDDRKKKVIESDPYSDKSGIVIESIARRAIQINFLNTDKLLKYVTENVKNIEMKYEDGYYYLKIEKDGDEQLSNIVGYYKINVENMSIEEFGNSIMSNEYDDYQFMEWKLSDIVFDNVSLPELENIFKLKKKEYKSEVHVPINVSDFKPCYGTLIDGTIAPNFKGKMFADNSDFSLEQFKGKVKILVFMKRICQPCESALPQLSKIHNEFHDVVVLGIDSKDNNEKNMEHIPKFIENHSIEFPMVLVGSEVDKIYSVKNYPTLYVIDKDGKIAYSQIGSSDDLYDKLKEVIEKIK